MVLMLKVVVGPPFCLEEIVIVPAAVLAPQFPLLAPPSTATCTGVRNQLELADRVAFSYKDMLILAFDCLSTLTLG